MQPQALEAATMRRASLSTQPPTRCAPIRSLCKPLQQGVLHLELFIHFSTMLIFRPRKRFTTLASVRLTGLRRRCSLLSEKWGELFHILNLIKIMMEQSSHTLRILKGYRNLSSNVYIDLLYTLSYEDMTLQEFTEMIRTDPANFFDSPEGVDWLVISSVIFDRS